MCSWEIDEDSKEGIQNLIELIREYYLLLSDTPDKIIAIGEVWAELEKIIDDDLDEESVYNVELMVGRRVKSEDFNEEGEFYGLRVNGEELVLDKLSTTYSRAIGSDHSINVYLNAAPGDLEFHIQIQDWLSDLMAIIEFDDVQLTVSRDHI
jgi:hypothetical protein